MKHKNLQQEKANDYFTNKPETELDAKLMQFKDQWNPVRLQGYLRLLGVPRELASDKAKEYERTLYNPILEGYTKR